MKNSPTLNKNDRLHLFIGFLQPLHLVMGRNTGQFHTLQWLTVKKDQNDEKESL